MEEIYNKFTCTKCLKTLDISDRCKDSSSPKGYSNRCKECNRKRNKQYYYKNKKEVCEKRKEYQQTENFKIIRKLWREKTGYKQKYKPSVKRSAYNVEYTRVKRQKDPLFRLSCNLRRRLHKALSFKNWTKKSKFNDYIGCDKEFLIKHLESQFTDGMTWDNYNKWEIDHIIPLSSAKTEEEIYKLCHYSNLQPLWAKDNRKKSGRLIPPNST